MLVETKLHPPAVRAGMVGRDMLVVRLAGGVHCGLVLVCAPAGWGKSVLLSQWRVAERDHRPFAWVSLDPSDDDPVRFWSYVIAALQTVAPEFGASVVSTLPNASLLDAVLPRLINDLAALPRPVVLVLDDYHVLSNELVHASVGYLLRHAPRTLQLALATRADPPMPLARLRAADELLEIRADDLRFAGEEADALLNVSLRLGSRPPTSSCSRSAPRAGRPGSSSRRSRCARAVTARPSSTPSRATTGTSSTTSARCSRACRPRCARSCCARRCSSACARRCATR